ncbi:MAG TPA: methylmalonyl Co-A mutase-associated GTPase MeaB [Polyangiaceae bacterium]|nr:methylmalonyl Co-A mutase-associated GTPase MeaB [Polyangiaceae bacterium]
MAEVGDDSVALAAALAAGDRRALARAITLVESERAEDGSLSEALLAAVLPRTGRSLRLGVSGPPGAGKSTLIDALGRHAIAHGERVAVLAIDPSSPIGGGSILGDKTRMSRLAAEPASFVRPSPSRGALGGVGRRTHESLLLCEAAGYSVVIVETLGTGQGDHAVWDNVDCLLLVLIAGAGDELQGMKRGVLELADLVVVNKADGENRAAAEQAASELTAALGLAPRARSAMGERGVGTVSAREESGIAPLWSAIEAHVARARASGELERRRAEGEVRALDAEVERTLRERLGAPELVAERRRLGALVLEKKLTPREAARKLIERLG